MQDIPGRIKACPFSEMQQDSLLPKRGCRTKQLVRSSFSMQKITARPRKNPAVGVKYKYANPYIITQELYFEWGRISTKTSLKFRNNHSGR